jgi:hypothetical protein
MVADLISVEKRKWDGSISSRETAWLLDCDASPLAWRVSAGTRRERPTQGDSELVEQNELWLSLPDAPVVLCSYLTPENTLERHELHAAWEPVGLNTGVLRWIDLDLDVVVEDQTVELLDEQAFMDNARTMQYPEHVVRSAWAGIAAVTARVINGDWPFNGFLDELARAEPGASAGD